MFAEKSVAGLKAATLFLFMAALAPAPVYSACPAGAVLETSPRIDESIPATASAVAVDMGSASVKMTYHKPKADLNVPPAPEHALGRTRLWTFPGYSWQFTVPLESNLNVSDLVVSYSISGAWDNKGNLSAPSAPGSSLGITIIPGPIQRIISGDKIIFRGYFDMEADFTRVTTSGRHGGTIATNVECR